LYFSNSLRRFAPRPSYLRGTVFFFSYTPPLSLEEVAFYAGGVWGVLLCFSNSLRRFAPRPSYLRGTVFFFSSTPPLSLEEVAFMPGSLKYFVLFFRTPSPLWGLTLRSALLGKAKASVVANNACYALSLLSKSESFLFSSPTRKTFVFLVPLRKEGQFLGGYL